MRRIAVVVALVFGILTAVTAGISGADTSESTQKTSPGIDGRLRRLDTSELMSVRATKQAAATGGGSNVAAADVLVNQCLGDDILMDPPGDAGPDLVMMTSDGACDGRVNFELWTLQDVGIFEVYLDTDPASEGCNGIDILAAMGDFGSVAFTLPSCDNDTWIEIDPVAYARDVGSTEQVKRYLVEVDLEPAYGVAFGVFNGDGEDGDFSTGVFTSTETTPCGEFRIESSSAPVNVDDGYWLATFNGSVWSAGAAASTGAACREVGAVTDGGVADLAITTSPDGNAGWVALHYDGRLTWAGDSPGSTLARHPWEVGATRAVTLMEAPLERLSRGLWVVYDNGAVVPINHSDHFGDARDIRLNRGIVDAVPTPSGLGYWLVGFDGGVFSYGDAEFYGSTGGIDLNERVLGMASDPDGEGYWLVAADGGVFAFDAPFVGSIPGVLAPGAALNRPIVGMVPYGDGYMLLGSDGGVFNFSNRAFAGSLGASPPEFPVVAIQPTRSPTRSSIPGYELVLNREFDIDGSVAVVVEPFASPARPVVHERNDNGEWPVVDELTLPPGDPGRLGDTVVVSNERIVTSYFGPDGWRLLVWTRSGAQWQISSRVGAGDARAGEGPAHVAFDNNRIAAVIADRTNPARAVLYTEQADGTWKKEIDRSTGIDQFLSPVGLSGDTVVIAAEQNTEILEWRNGDWLRTGVVGRNYFSDVEVDGNNLTFAYGTYLMIAYQRPNSAGRWVEVGDTRRYSSTATEGLDIVLLDTDTAVFNGELFRLVGGEWRGRGRSTRFSHLVAGGDGRILDAGRGVIYDHIPGLD